MQHRMRDYDNPYYINQHFYENSPHFENILTQKYGLEDVQQVRKHSKSPERFQKDEFMKAITPTPNRSHSPPKHTHLPSIENLHRDNLISLNDKLKLSQVSSHVSLGSEISADSLR